MTLATNMSLKKSAGTIKGTLTETEAIDGLLVIPKLEDNDYSKLEAQTKTIHE